MRPHDRDSQGTLSTLPALWNVWCKAGTGCRRNDAGKLCVCQKPCARGDGKEIRGTRRRSRRVCWMPGEEALDVLMS